MRWHIPVPLSKSPLRYQVPSDPTWAGQELLLEPDRAEHPQPHAVGPAALTPFWVMQPVNTVGLLIRKRGTSHTNGSPGQEELGAILLPTSCLMQLLKPCQRFAFRAFLRAIFLQYLTSQMSFLCFLEAWFFGKSKPPLNFSCFPLPSGIFRLLPGPWCTEPAWGELILEGIVWQHEAGCPSSAVISWHSWPREAGTPTCHRHRAIPADGHEPGQRGGRVGAFSLEAKGRIPGQTF